MGYGNDEWQRGFNGLGGSSADYRDGQRTRSFIEADKSDFVIVATAVIARVAVLGVICWVVQQLGVRFLSLAEGNTGLTVVGIALGCGVAYLLTFISRRTMFWIWMVLIYGFACWSVYFEGAEGTGPMFVFGIFAAYILSGMGGSITDNVY